MRLLRWRWTLWPVVAAAFYAVFIARTRFLVGGVSYFSMFDDAMISLRYARNIASGLGPVWNPGDLPVEGFTNPLWTLWMAALHAVGLSESKVSLAVMVSGALLLLAGAWLAGRIAHRVGPGSRPAVAASAWGTALCYPLVFWTLRGVEVGLLAACVGAAVLSVYHVVHEPSRRSIATAALILATLPLVRPDGVVPAVVLAGCVLAYGYRRSGWVAGSALMLAIVVSAGLATIARLAVFGDPLPNTYYLKMTGVAADERLRRGGWMMLQLFLIQLWPLALLAALNGRRLARWPLAPLAWLVVAQLAYSVYVGGDAWEWMRYANRYVSVALPAFIVLAALGATRLRTSPSLARRFVVVAGLGGGGVVVGLAGSVFLRVGWQPSFFLREPTFRAAVAWSGLVGGLALVALGLGALTRWRPARSRLDSALARLSCWGDGRFALAVTAGLLVWLSGPGLAHWVLTRGVHVSDDAVATRTGLLLREATDPRASIAVVWAGAIPYFAHRHAVDLLGKNDRRIAREPGRGAFYPGHNKQDLDYSIGELRPDVIVQLPEARPGELRILSEIGYLPVGNGMLVAPWARLRDRGALARPISSSMP